MNPFPKISGRLRMLGQPPAGKQDIDSTLRFTLVAMLMLALILPPSNGHATDTAASLKTKKIALVIAPADFRDEEYLDPKALFEKRDAAVTTICTTTQRVVGMGGAEALPTLLLKDAKAEEFDAVVFVGGPGAREYYDHPDALRLAREAFARGKVVAAICVAPNILATAGVLKNRKATAWAFEVPVPDVIQVHQDVVRDSLVVTANGPASSSEFALAVCDTLTDSTKTKDSNRSPGAEPGIIPHNGGSERTNQPSITQ